MEETMHSPLTDACICRANGWGPGTLLQGELNDADEEPPLVGITVLKITAVGGEEILARAISIDGQLIQSEETRFSLDGVEWIEVDVRFNPVETMPS